MTRVVATTETSEGFVQEREALGFSGKPWAAWGQKLNGQVLYVESFENEPDAIEHAFYAAQHIHLGGLYAARGLA